MRENDESMIYADEDVDLGELSKAYSDALLNIDEYFDACETSYDDRRSIWPGKTADLRKGGANAFPWKGASDQEVNVCGERLDTYVALFAQALERSHIKAFPTSSAAMPRAALVSSFLKWMRSDYIPDLKNQMELGSNYLVEKGMMISYVGWKRERRTFLQLMTLEEIASEAPEIVDMMLDPSNDDVMSLMLQQAFPMLSDKRAKKALRQLRKTGEAEIPSPRVTVDCPVVHSCAPDGEVIFPSYVTDPQRSPYIFWRTFLTAQELEKKVATDGWNAEWVEYAIENLRGKDSEKIEGERKRNVRNTINDNEDLVMVLYAYRRLIDEDDLSEGIYCTVFHPDAIDAGHAKHELLNGLDDYPFVVTRLSQDQKRLYEVQPMTKSLRGPQMQIKAERDSRIDRSSLATLPPIMHPAGRPPGDWGPGRKIGYRRLGEIAFGPTPPFDPGSIEAENSMRMQADRSVGLDPESPFSPARQQFYVSKFLDHVAGVLSLAWQLFLRVGPDEVFFQVTGNPNPQLMTKGDPDTERFSIKVAFDSQSTDPDTAELRAKQMGSILQFDRNGRIDIDKFLEFLAMSIDPILADYVLQPTDVAADKMQKEVTDDLAKIWAAIEVPARPNGAQVAMQIIQAYAQQPDVASRLQQDEAFAERITKYANQYQFQLQQAQNAQIGRIGTAPAEVGGMNTQQMAQ